MQLHSTRRFLMRPIQLQDLAAGSELLLNGAIHALVCSLCGLETGSNKLTTMTNGQGHTFCRHCITTISQQCRLIVLYSRPRSIAACSRFTSLLHDAVLLER